jgi:putative ABC transport system permease protein
VLNGVAKGWAFDVRPLEEIREGSLKATVLSVKILAIIDMFLMIMVALGLIGVLWQNVTQRTMEIGLRRAQGATTADICWQIMGEVFFIATLGIIPGILLIVQFPLLSLIGDLKTSIYFYSIAISMLLIYLMTFICGLYPGWLATRIRPVEALHHE